MTPDQMKNYEDLLPEGGLPMCGFRLLSYLNSEGTICYQFAYSGDVNGSQFIGLLEMVKFDITRVATERGRKGLND